MDSTTPTAEAASPSPWIKAGLDFRNLGWVALSMAVMVWVILLDEYDWPIRFVHVASGVLLTGADVILGFIVGPTLRRLDWELRRQFTLKLLPKTLFIMTPLGIIAPTSGYYYAERLGYMDVGYPEFYWIIGALVVSLILAIQGIFILLPTNIRAYLEMRKAAPDVAKVTGMMGMYFYVTASQGVMQVLIVTIMVKMAGTGL